MTIIHQADRPPLQALIREVYGTPKAMAGLLLVMHYPLTAEAVAVQVDGYEVMKGSRFHRERLLLEIETGAVPPGGER